MNNPENQTILTYSFTKKETGLLAKFFREKETELPRGLENFFRSIENTLYDNLTLDEVKKFYS